VAIFMAPHMSVRATAYWVIGIVIFVAVGAELKQKVFTGTTRVSNQPTEASSTEDQHTREHPSMQSEKALSAAVQQGPALDSTKVSRTAGGRPTNGNEPQPPASNQVGTDESVIGSPFQISSSVETACRSFIVCGETHEMLSKLAQEPRDYAWASQMETAIQENVVAQGSDKYTIRDIECRSTLCAVETASSYGNYLGPAYPDPLIRSLHGMDPIWAYEASPSGVKITVTLEIFRRR